MSNEKLADAALKPPFGLASMFFVIVAVVSFAGTLISIMDSVGGSPLKSLVNFNAATTSFQFFCGSVFALAVLKGLRQIVHELRRNRAPTV